MKTMDFLKTILNLNSLLVTCQSVANLDTQSSDISAEEISESGRSFQSLIVCIKKLLLYASLLAEGI